MIQMLLQTIFLSVAGFAAAFVDSIAGGGGLISLPAFLAAGVPAHLALGTNKFASTAASFTSSLSYARSDKVNWELPKYLIPMTLIGAVGGVQTVLQIDQSFLNLLVLLLILGVGIYTLVSKNLGAEDHFKGVSRGRLLGGIVLALGLGFYDGFFGPGTGSFLMFGLVGLYGFDFVRAGGNARVLNFISNITALILFALHGRINYGLGLPVLVAMICGARLGSVFALKQGVKVVKPIFVTIALAVAGKLLWNLLG